MRIVFLGNFSVPYSTESHHLWTYRKLGHDVTTLQEGKATALDVMKEIQYGCDLFVWTHTHAWHTSGMDVVLQHLKERKIPSVGYHLDLWKGIKREADLNNDQYWNIEYFFTADKNFVPDLQARGIKAYYLPAGVVENECYLADPDRDRFPHDVIFVGSKGYHPEWPYRPKLINWLKETYSGRFGHYGGDGLGTIRGHDLNVLYASARVVVGDTLCINFNYPYYFSDRLFETTGRGGFMIFPYIEGLGDFFRVDHQDLNREVVQLVTYDFDDFKTLKLNIDYYLNNDKYREQIKINGYERTKRDHTYTQRLAKLLTIVQNDRDGNNKTK